MRIEMNTCKVFFCNLIDYKKLQCYIVIKCNQGEYMKEKRLPRSIRLEPEIEKWLIDKAKADDRSFNAEVNRLLRQAKEEREKIQRAA